MLSTNFDGEAFSESAPVATDNLLLSTAKTASPSDSKDVVTARLSANKTDAELAARADDLSKKVQTPNTKRAYRAAWSHFESWCARRGVAALPTETWDVPIHAIDTDREWIVA